VNEHQGRARPRRDQSGRDDRLSRSRWSDENAGVVPCQRGYRHMLIVGQRSVE
jgi:hypothetical protein